MGGAQSETSGPTVGRGAGLAFALVCVVLATLVTSAQAQAPPIRGLDFRDCVGDNSFPLGPCDGGAPAVLAPADVVVSPDGRNVYVASADDSAIGIYDRRAADGSLTAAGCVDDNDPRVGVESCAESSPNLKWASAVVVSDDGRHVVAGSFAGHAVSHFNRDPADGALIPTGCVADPAAFAGCSSTRSGLYRVSDVAISPDSNFAYAASEGSDAIVSFDLRGGGMSAIQCVGDHDSAPPDCPGFARGLAGPSEIAISPDGRNLYAVSRKDGAIGIYRRNATTGQLTYDDCKQGAEGVEGCGAPDEPGLLGELQGIAISADGRSVAVTSRSETPGGGPIANAIASMSRLPIGSIGTSQCFASAGVPFCETIAAEVSHGALDFSPTGPRSCHSARRWRCSGVIQRRRTSISRAARVRRPGAAFPARCGPVMPVRRLWKAAATSSGRPMTSMGSGSLRSIISRSRTGSSSSRRSVARGGRSATSRSGRGACSGPAN